MPQAPDHPDRVIELQSIIERDVFAIVDKANSAGYSAKEAQAALRAVINSVAIAMGEDPDPADDPQTA